MLKDLSVLYFVSIQASSRSKLLTDAKQSYISKDNRSKQRIYRFQEIVELKEKKKSQSWFKGNVKLKNQELSR